MPGLLFRWIQYYIKKQHTAVLIVLELSSHNNNVFCLTVYSCSHSLTTLHTYTLTAYLFYCRAYRASQLLRDGQLTFKWPTKIFNCLYKKFAFLISNSMCVCFSSINTHNPCSGQQQWISPPIVECSRWWGQHCIVILSDAVDWSWWGWNTVT